MSAEIRRSPLRIDAISIDAGRIAKMPTLSQLMDKHDGRV